MISTITYAPNRPKFPYIGIATWAPEGGVEAIVWWLGPNDGIVLRSTKGLTPVGTKWTTGEHHYVPFKGAVSIANS